MRLPLLVSLKPPSFLSRAIHDANDVDTDLLGHKEGHEQAAESAATAASEAPLKDVKGTYVSIHSSGFRDSLLEPYLLRAEHPSEGKVYSESADASCRVIFSVSQHEYIAQAVLGMDVLCQAKSGMDKFSRRSSKWNQWMGRCPFLSCATHASSHTRSRTFLQIHAFHQDGRLLWRHQREERRGDTAHHIPSHRSRHFCSTPGSSPKQNTQS